MYGIGVKFKEFLFSFILLVVALFLIPAKSALACDYETVCVSEGYYTQRYIPPVYGYTECGTAYVAYPARYESYYIPPRYIQRPIYTHVYVAPVYYTPVYRQPVYYGRYAGGSSWYSRGWRGW